MTVGHAFQHVLEVSERLDVIGASASHPGRRSTAREDAVLEPLVKSKVGCDPVDNLDEIGLAAAEHEQVPREGVLPQHALDQHGEPIDALAHIDEAEGEVNLHAQEAVS